MRIHFFTAPFLVSLIACAIIQKGILSRFEILYLLIAFATLLVSIFK